MDFDVITNQIVKTQAFTIRAEHAIISDTHTEIFGARQGRLDAMQAALTTHILQMRPNFAITETPFMGNHASAFGALMETICAIRNACAAYDPHMNLMGIDPPSAKKMVGAPGNAKKPQMQEAVGAILPALGWDEQSCGEFLKLDEHSVDAIAIAKSMHTWFVHSKVPF